MKKIKLISLLFICLCVACTGKKEKLQTNIVEKEKIVSESMDDLFDKSTAESLRLDYLDYARQFPEDTLAPIYMHKAAELSINLNMPQEAINTIDSISLKYADYKFLPDVIFFKGFIQETYLHDKNAAKQTYNLFLEKFPNDSMATQVKFSIDNIDKSPEDILKMFEEKNKQTDTVPLISENND